MAGETNTTTGTTGEKAKVNKGGGKKGPPAGMTKAASDLQAYYDPDESGGITFKALFCNLMDGNIQKTKASNLITCELLEEARLQEPPEKDSDKKVFRMFPAGTIFGIWGKPGMRDLKDHAGVKVYMEPEGEKDVGKGNPMKLFGIYFDDKNPGGKLKVKEDRRDKSLPDSERRARAAAAQAVAAGTSAASDTDTDDIPF